MVRVEVLLLAGVIWRLDHVRIVPRPSSPSPPMQCVPPRSSLTIAAAIAAGVAAGDATLTQNAAAFAAGQAPELVVNSPANRVLTGAQTIGAFKAGLIHYASSERVIEYAAVRPNGEVLLMGAEHITPLGATRNAGHAETYRVTEIWRDDGGTWKLSVRHATISEVK